MQIALVGQEPVLFSRSLKDNITYGLDDLCDMQQLQHAALLSNSHDFITQMSEQYETQAGEKGLQLSGIKFQHNDACITTVCSVSGTSIARETFMIDTPSA